MADRNTSVTVIVGDDKHPFQLNEQQLCACSPVFLAMLRNGFMETEERIVLLPSRIVKNVPAVYGGAPEGQNGENNGTPKSKGARAGTPDVQTRCVIVTGGVDSN